MIGNRHSRKNPRGWGSPGVDAKAEEEGSTGTGAAMVESEATSGKGRLTGLEWC